MGFASEPSLVRTVVEPKRCPPDAAGNQDREPGDGASVWSNGYNKQTHWIEVQKG